MKKTSVITINLKSARLFISLCAFLSVIYLCTTLSVNLPAFTLEEDFIRFILSCNASYNESPFPSVGAFSLTRKVFSDTEEKNPSNQKVGVATEKVQVPAVKEPEPVVNINNSTSLDIDAEKYLSVKPAFLTDDFSVLIVHTHTTESYTPSPKYDYTPTDTDRTTNKNYNMVAVGKEIEKILSSSGIKVYHDTTINDHPSYSGSYNKSAMAIENHIRNDSSIKIVLDVHRDAILDKNGEKVKYSTTIDGKETAKIMFVVGSNLSGLEHNNWEDNMQFAAQLQKHTLSLYPDLCRPINFRKQRFNQQLAPGGIIVEVGTNANTLDEAILGARYFATALADFIEKGK